MGRWDRAGIAAAAAALACLLAPGAATAAGDRARDFTQPLPEMRVAGSPAAERGRTEFTTPRVRAPREFDLVGVAGEMGAVEIRARELDGEWSPWVETGNGDPVYTGGARAVQIRSHEPLDGELHYVALPEPGPTPNALRGQADRRATDVSKPKFVSRSAWGANGRGGCTPRDRPDTGRVKAAVVHHTVSTNSYSEAQAPGIVLGICRYHRNANGWDDIGYNALVDRFGNLYEGRGGGVDRAIVGAQAEGHNSETTGIASIGDHRSTGITGPSKRAIVAYIAWKLDLAGLPATGRTRLTSTGGSTTKTPKGERIRVKRIIGHTDLNETECPGTKLRAQIASIRRAVQVRMGEYQGGSSEPEDPEKPAGPSGGVGP